MNDPGSNAGPNPERPADSQESPSATAIFFGLLERQTAQTEMPEDCSPFQTRPASKLAPSLSRQESQPMPITAQSDAYRVESNQRSAPGEFTQLFQALVPPSELAPRDGADSKTAKIAVSNVNAADSSAEDFTSIFVQIPISSVAAKSTFPPQSTQVPMPTGQVAIQGQTNLTQSPVAMETLNPNLDRVAKPVEAAEPTRETSRSEGPDPGTFTQLFQPAFTEASSPSNASQPPPHQTMPSSLTAEYKRIFRSADRAEQSRGFEVNNPLAFSNREMAVQPQPAGKRPGITELMQALGAAEVQDEVVEATAHSETPSFAPMQIEAPISLSSSQRISSLPPVVTGKVGVECRSAEPAPPSSALTEEPGEYTRIISGAVLRELSKMGGASPGTDPAKAVTSLPKAEFRLPSAPSGVEMQARPVPMLPSLPEAKMSVPERSKLQEYLPLLLILNAFLLVVLIVLVLLGVKLY